MADNRAVEPGEVVAELWRRIQARDWSGVGELLAEDFVLEWPHDLVRLRGRANFVEFNRSYPEGWSIEVLRVVAQGNTVVSEVRVPHPTVGPPGGQWTKSHCRSVRSFPSMTRSASPERMRKSS